jgi:hypothetical protein
VKLEGGGENVEDEVKIDMCLMEGSNEAGLERGRSSRGSRAWTHSTTQHSIHNASCQKNSRDGQLISIGILQISMGFAVQCAISLVGVVSRWLLQTLCHCCLVACEARAGGLEV